MVEGLHKAQGKYRTLRRVISSHQDSSSSSSREMNTETNTTARGEHYRLKSKCCSSWGIIKKFLNLHEQKFAELGAAATNFQVFQNTTNATLKNLETQVGQLALTLQSQKKDAFPSDTKKNPKDCMAVQLRSGKELEMMIEKVDSSTEKESSEKER